MFFCFFFEIQSFFSFSKLYFLPLKFQTVAIFAPIGKNYNFGRLRPKRKKLRYNSLGAFRMVLN